MLTKLLWHPTPLSVPIQTGHQNAEHLANFQSHRIALWLKSRCCKKLEMGFWIIVKTNSDRWASSSERAKFAGNYLIPWPQHQASSSSNHKWSNFFAAQTLWNWIRKQLSPQETWNPLARSLNACTRQLETLIIWPKVSLNIEQADYQIHLKLSGQQEWDLLCW